MTKFQGVFTLYKVSYVCEVRQSADGPRALYILGKNGPGTIFLIVLEFGENHKFFVERSLNSNISTTLRTNFVFLSPHLSYEET